MPQPTSTDDNDRTEIPADHPDSSTDDPRGDEDDGTQNQEVADEAVHATLHDAMAEGHSRLARGWPAVLATGFIGGLDLGFGVMAMLAVRAATGSEQLGALAFSIGFIALVLGRSELFTENFLVPVVAVIEDLSLGPNLARLWTGTLLANLTGGWVVMALVVAGVPEIRDSPELQELGGHFIEQGITGGTLASAILGGAAITLLTWMERSTTAVFGKVVAAIAIAFVLAGTPLLHSIVSSLEIFGALQAGAEFGYLDWLGTFSWAVLGNMLGGVLLVTVLRVVQARSD